MQETLTALFLSILASFLYDALKTFALHKPTIKDSHEYSKKYFRAVKTEFFVSFPTGIVCMALSTTISNSMSLFLKTLSFFMFLIAFMAFVCLSEMVNNLTHDDSDNDVV